MNACSSLSGAAYLHRTGARWASESRPGVLESLRHQRHFLRCTWRLRLPARNKWFDSMSVRFRLAGAATVLQDFARAMTTDILQHSYWTRTDTTLKRCIGERRRDGPVQGIGHLLHGSRRGA